MGMVGSAAGEAVSVSRGSAAVAGELRTRMAPKEMRVTAFTVLNSAIEGRTSTL